MPPVRYASHEGFFPHPPLNPSGPKKLKSKKWSKKFIDFYLTAAWSKALPTSPPTREYSCSSSPSSRTSLHGAAGPRSSLQKHHIDRINAEHRGREDETELCNTVAGGKRMTGAVCKLAQPSSIMKRPRRRSRRCAGEFAFACSKQENKSNSEAPWAAAAGSAQHRTAGSSEAHIKHLAAPAMPGLRRSRRRRGGGWKGGR
uniref:Uncharacterized protein n=1 Tax=Sphaerodactylus townsendi TaxID=933632 RepID=A0ACB8EY36_9SAUR